MFYFLNKLYRLWDLEKDNYKIPIIALTANSIAGDEEKYLAQGMNNYLSKPINVTKLKELISIYLFSDEKL